MSFSLEASNFKKDLRCLGPGCGRGEGGNRARGRGGWQQSAGTWKMPIQTATLGRQVGEAGTTLLSARRFESSRLQRDLHVVSQNKSACLVRRTTAARLGG